MAIKVKKPYGISSTLKPIIGTNINSEYHEIDTLDLQLLHSIIIAGPDKNLLEFFIVFSPQFGHFCTVSRPYFL